MKRFVKNVIVGIGVVSMFISSGICFGKTINEQQVYAENEYQEDVDPQLIHYRSQYYQLLEDYNTLQEENDLLRMQIDKVSRPNYDIDGDGLVTVCDVVKLIRFLAEEE